MGLAKYRQKRTFEQTPEPTGGKAAVKGLRFVVQKHAATRLHYDFRLEMDGVLKSWAVPKGPSLNPEDKRLAMMVEDHPYDYRNFEGIIPKGNYGAGTVIVWDEGYFEPLEPSGDKKTDEKKLLKQLKSGSLKVNLHGKKLNGEFALVKLKNAEENAWLLIKHRDRYASESDITAKDKSVLSRKSIEQMTKRPEKVYGIKDAAEKKGSSNTAKAKKSTVTKSGSARKPSDTKPVSKKSAGRVVAAAAGNAAPRKSAVKKAASKSSGKKKVRPVAGPESAFPSHQVKPMLATLVDKPFDEPGWIHEIKWDGYRAIAFSHHGKVDLLSRNQKSFNEKFYPVYEAVRLWGIDGVVDGEICVLNNKGIAHFGSLQNWRSEADGDLVYYVFDLLWLDGHDLKALPLTERRQLLRERMPGNSIIRFSESFDSPASEFLEAAAKLGMEGIMAKKADSPYVPGDRSATWLKIKANQRHEVVIGGYTLNDDSNKPFSSLLVGVYEKNGLRYTGKIGTGFNIKMQKEMMAAFSKRIRKTSPFTEVPDVNKPSRFRPDPPHATVTWLKPDLVCEVSYTELTSDGVMRHPSFEGMREDKPAANVKAENAVSSTKVLSHKENRQTNKLLKPVTAGDKKTLLNPSEETQVKKIDGHELTFTNLSKIYWPGEKITKRDMLNYYYQVAPFILPYIINRPQSLNRFPHGIRGKSFYQKDVTGKVPPWIKQHPYTTSEGEQKNFLVPDKAADLLYMANLGAIEMNPWNSTVKKPDHPDWCMIDLDPDKGNSFEQVIETALAVKTVLDEFNVDGYPKTSGSTGIHIYLPMGAKYTYDECQLFGKIIATQVHGLLPDITSIERLTRNRKKKIYIDYLQNRPKATLAAPYSLRPKPGATVSMPLQWEEVKKGLQMKDFNIHNAMDRIKSAGDLFKPVLGKGIDLKKLLAKITKQG
ncbi:DNA ligase D [Flavihumibacter petaseus]|uniref:DNA ligase (ATP) n=1 Tax=Flavihumibacter petaseus NBRC 106054 TaxID=1220578 RepID=A0A0E9MU71_9BACT|nr:DNA ligase D [Flavihumibacter petaseus]GAO41023.1 putative ATP-dependent DNA ligase [Flavihumibacter petaseus NBRC 106054]